MEKLNLIATTTFGLEASVKRELQNLGYKDLKTLDGRIDFTGDFSDIVKTNIHLRCASRIQLRISEFEAVTFEELFEKTKAIKWSDIIPKDGMFTVIGKSVKSTLFSVSDCQAIVKKAVVESMKSTYKIDWFEETGAEYKIQVALLKDKVTLTIDTTGQGLHKRGYRPDAMLAPLKETMAAGLIELSYWKKDRILLDPVCGSGTIPIEAALMAKNIAPGLRRTFACEGWHHIDKSIWKNVRTEAFEAINKDFIPEISGSDIDPEAIEVAKHNARMAGVDDCIRFEVRPLKETIIKQDYGIVICNPPYGERIGEINEVKQLYKDMGNIFLKNDTWSVYVITSLEDFEKHYGKKANAKRKLFNGNMKTDYYQYTGPRPPRV